MVTSQRSVEMTRLDNVFPVDETDRTLFRKADSRVSSLSGMLALCAGSRRRLSAFF